MKKVPLPTRYLSKPLITLFVIPAPKKPSELPSSRMNGGLVIIQSN